MLFLFVVAVADKDWIPSYMSEPFTYPLIEGFWIKNYKVFRQVAIGSSFQQSVVTDFADDVVPYELTPLTLFAGDSGIGKSTILDAFAFIADSLQHGISEALSRRGGFGSVFHFNGTGPISFGIVFRPCNAYRTLTYILNIDTNKTSRHPFIETEAVIYRDNEVGGQPRPVLLFQNGEKQTRLVQPWGGVSGTALDLVKRTDSIHLGLAALAQNEELPDIPLFKHYLDQFFVSCYASSNAAGLSPAKFKFTSAGNLALDLKRFKEKHPFEFEHILDVIAQRMSGIEKINYEITEAGRTLLSFNVAGRDEPIYPAQLGEGNMRLLTYLMLFEDPQPTPLIGIEEPAAFMGASQIKAFTKLIQYHIRELGGTQVFATTNNNVLIDQMDPTEVWFLSQDNNGSIQVSRGLDELQFLGIDLSTVGPYWYSKYLYQDQTSVEGTSSIMHRSLITPRMS